MEKMLMKKRYARTHEYAASNDANSQALRIYKDSPKTAHIQFRTFGPITESRKGKSRYMISGASFSVEEMREIINALESCISQINE